MDSASSTVSPEEPPPPAASSSSSNSSASVTPNLAVPPPPGTTSEMPTTNRCSKLHLLVMANGSRETAYAQTIALRLSKDPKVAIRVVVDDATPRMVQAFVVASNVRLSMLPDDNSTENGNYGNSNGNSSGCGSGNKDHHPTNHTTTENSSSSSSSAEDVAAQRRQLMDLHHHSVVDLVEWADFMVLCPIDADHLAKMMGGHADNLMLAILRSWDASKRILLVPGMSTTMWENPVTKRQMSKLHRKWHWCRVLPPILWHYEHLASAPYHRRVVEWAGLDEVLGIIKNQADLLTMGLDVDVKAATEGRNNLSSPRRRRRKRRMLLHRGLDADADRVGGSGRRDGDGDEEMDIDYDEDEDEDDEDEDDEDSDDGSEPPTHVTLPPEIWSLILEYTNDWELAQALGVFTTLEMPTSQGWRLEPKDPNDPLQVFMHRLEWKLLTADSRAICAVLDTAPPGLSDLSALAIKLVFKFGLTEVLTHIEGHCPVVFRNFDGKTVPTKASAYFGRTDILDWWARSPSFLEKQYDAEAMDGASRNGYVHVLEWWRRSGLPLKYSEAALEQASSRGHLRVLEWWRDASAVGSSSGGAIGAGAGVIGADHHHHHHNQQHQHHHLPPSPQHQHQQEPQLQHQLPHLVPKPGRSLSHAAQAGQCEVLKWWMSSGIAVDHMDSVCKMASRWGRVDVLETWRQLRGDDIIFNAQVLVDPTMHSFIDVLEWWRSYARGELPGMEGKPARRVEYRTMDIEEALEDSLGDQTRVRRWWAENGLNLGLGTSEWMKSRYL